MQSYKEKYRPRKLAEIVGQPAVKSLSAIVANPRPCCLLLCGATGTGKSTAARAIARELGCEDGWIETSTTICAAKLNVDSIDSLFGSSSPFRLVAPNGWHVLIIEELEYCRREVAVLLKHHLAEGELPRNLIVVATSNNTADIPQAVLDRFQRYTFDGGALLSRSIGAYLAAIWSHETPHHPFPADWKQWGWCADTEAFSARRALDACEEAARQLAAN